ncbi:hypothetical protein QCA50_014406 [Cerrena zonata]|uniref:Decapping nuclease n=1 Tax=Cerrena zonata TaxID=2478898 RepID=A0AAW0FZ34_9APHY
MASAGKTQSPRTMSEELAYPPKTTNPPTSVSFQKPSLLLTFSYNESHELEFTNSSLRYYVQPPKNADLNYGYDRWKQRADDKGRIDSLLRAISKNRSNLDASGKDGRSWLQNIDIVSWRGVITKILTSPYEKWNSFELNVMFHDGTMYFEEFISNQRQLEYINMPPRQRRPMYYGFAFESYCTSTSPKPSHAKGGWGGDVDNHIQWCNVVETKLGDTKILIGGEVDCVRGKYTGTTDNFVELKTSLTIHGPWDESRFEKKLLKFYFQSFLLGVPEIVVGFRTRKGRLSTLQTFKTADLPGLVRDKPGGWNPLICLHWGTCFIDFLKSIVTSHSPSATNDIPVWRVSFTPQKGVSISLLSQEGVEEVVNGEDRVGFLPKWYFDEITTKS